MSSLLPPNATPAETGLATALARIGEIAVPVDRLWDADACPAELLPWLAWALSVDTWDETWPEDTRRAVIKASMAVHKIKGTPAAIQRALAACGFGDSVVMEHLHDRRHDGSARYDAKVFHGAGELWATYRVILTGRPIANRQVPQVRAVLAAAAPARSHLLSLDYRTVPNIHDGASRYDGAYNHGVAL